MNIILASQSPRRKELLSRMGLSGFKTMSPDIDENLGGGLRRSWSAASPPSKPRRWPSGRAEIP